MTTDTTAAGPPGAHERSPNPVALVAAVALAYLVAALLGLSLALPPGRASAVFPASGIALAAMLLRGRRTLPGVWLGSLLANLLTVEIHGGTNGPVEVLVGSLVGLGATLEALLAHAVLVRLRVAQSTLHTPRGVIAFVALAAPLGAAVSAAVGVATLVAVGVMPPDTAPLQALTWWLGDTTGVLLVTPLLLAQVERWRRGARTGVANVVVALLLGALLVAALGVAFGPINVARLPLAYLPLPALLLITLWGGAEGATLGVFVTALVAVVATARHLGSFWAESLSTNATLLVLQTYVAFVAFATMLLAANQRQRDVALAAVEAARGDLERQVAKRTAEVREAYDRILREQQQRRLHVEHTPLGVIEWDAAFRVVAWNPSAERIFGYRSDEAVGRPGYELVVPPGARPQVDGVWAALLRQRGGTRSTNPNVRKDGRLIQCEWYNTPLAGPDGRVLGVASLVQDVTDRVTAEAERDRLLVAYRAAIATRDEFLAIAAHELRTPVQSVRLAAESARRRAAESPELARRLADPLAMVVEQADRLATQVDELLDLTRLQEGRVPLDLGPHDLARIVRDVVESQAGVLAASGSTCTLEASEPVPCVVDAARVSHVVANLLTNAIKYGEGRPIDVAVVRRGDDAVIEVRDHGIGIAAGDQERVFERYARAVSSRNYSGFGLGLYILRVIVEAHGGRVGLDSAPGVGSTFVVSFPAERPPTGD